MNDRFISTLKTLLGSIAASLVLVYTVQAQPAAAQTAPEEQEKLVKYSLYYEDFKNGNYESALPNLRWILENAPAFHGPGRLSDVNYERAIALYDSLASKTGSRDWLDSALVLFDNAVPVLTEAGAEVDEYLWTFNKARFIQNHAEQLPDLQDEALVLYRKAYDLAPDRIQPYYIYLLIQDYAAEDKQKAIDFMEDVEQKFQGNEEVIGYITQVRNSLFTSPEERMAFLEEQLEKNPNDTEIVRELFEIYQELGERDKMYEIGERLNSMEPSVETLRILANLRLGDGEPKAAYDMLQQMTSMPGYKPIAEDQYNMGVAQQQMGSLSRARQHFREAIKLNPNFGRAYIGIGDLYVTAVSECSSTFEREDRAVYWLATDYYERARQVDPSVANMAETKIRSYRRSFPDQEALFFKGWKVGDSYAVNYGCYAWIGENTTVKAP